MLACIIGLDEHGIGRGAKSQKSLRAIERFYLLSCLYDRWIYGSVAMTNESEIEIEKWMWNDHIYLYLIARKLGIGYWLVLLGVAD